MDVEVSVEAKMIYTRGNKTWEHQQAENGHGIYIYTLFFFFVLYNVGQSIDTSRNDIMWQELCCALGSLFWEYPKCIHVHASLIEYQDFMYCISSSHNAGHGREIRPLDRARLYDRHQYSLHETASWTINTMPFCSIIHATLKGRISVEGPEAPVI